MRIFFRKIRSAVWHLNRFIFHGPVYWNFVRVFIPSVYKTRGNESAVNVRIWFLQKLIGYNRNCYWPVHFTSNVIAHKNIYVGIDAAPGISPNCYINGTHKIWVDDYAQVAPNVSLISSEKMQHTAYGDLSIYIGKYARIGMGSVVKGGVVLGDFTTVFAGSVVEDSFPEGYCVIGGNPAVILVDYSKNLSVKEKFIRYRNTEEYNGYIPSSKFEAYRKKNLCV